MNQQEIKKTINDAIKKYKGQVSTLECAIGALHVGQTMGWKTLCLMHSKSQIKKFEKILAIKFKEVLPEEGPLKYKSFAGAALDKITNYWKAVSGDIKIANRSKLK